MRMSYRSEEEQRGYDAREHDRWASTPYGESYEFRMGFEERDADERRERAREEEREEERAREAQEERDHARSQREREQEPDEQEQQCEQWQEETEVHG